MARIAAALLVVLALLPAHRAEAADDVEVREIYFRWEQPERIYDIQGVFHEPAASPGCNNSVIVLLHGFSYGQWQWDFPLQPGLWSDPTYARDEVYSTARFLARRGYPVVAIDRAGYGRSNNEYTQGRGHDLTIEEQAFVASFVADRLRTSSFWTRPPGSLNWTHVGSTSRRFQRVGLYGHGAGAEIAQYAAGRHGAANVLILGGFTHSPELQFGLTYLLDEMPRALLSERSYFGRTPANRQTLMYHPNHPFLVEGPVMMKDAQLANLTPSGEILSSFQRPSQEVVDQIDVPVRLVLGDNDQMYPTEGGQSELARFSGTTDKSLQIANVAGHSYMLHRSAPYTNQGIVNWLNDPFRRHHLPKCS